MTRILIGESVWEKATMAVHDGMLWIEFDDPDFDNIAIPEGELFNALVPAITLRELVPIMEDHETFDAAKRWIVGDSPFELST